jgi:2-polyprenyl-3-methyl-5-hydroxy-6-metoxy-1,4-benzoquinol methylase
MRTVAQVQCPNCNADGTPVYADLRDKVYGAPGRWRMQRCGNRFCGAWWLDPAPHAEDLATAYTDYHTHECDAPSSTARSTLAAVRDAYVAYRLGTHTNAGWATRFVSRFVPLFPGRSDAALYSHFYLPCVPGGTVFEVGCGAGLQLETLASDGWDARGADIDPEAVAVARSRGLDVSVGDIRDLDLPAGSFDAVVMAQVIEHVYDPVGLLARCAELLKPGGRLISITPNADSMGHRLYRRDWRGLEPPRHLVLYTSRALHLACRRAGLVPERVEVTARDASNMMLASARIRDVDDGSLIERPRAGRRPPLSLRLLAGLERIGIALGLRWGEELVLSARK